MLTITPTQPKILAATCSFTNFQARYDHRREHTGSAGWLYAGFGTLCSQQEISNDVIVTSNAREKARKKYFSKISSAIGEFVR